MVERIFQEQHCLREWYRGGDEWERRDHVNNTHKRWPNHDCCSIRSIICISPSSNITSISTHPPQPHEHQHKQPITLTTTTSITTITITTTAGRNTSSFHSSHGPSRGDRGKREENNGSYGSNTNKSTRPSSSSSSSSSPERSSSSSERSSGSPRDDLPKGRRSWNSSTSNSTRNRTAATPTTAAEAAEVVGSASESPTPQDSKDKVEP